MNWTSILAGIDALEAEAKAGLVSPAAIQTYIDLLTSAEAAVVAAAPDAIVGDVEKFGFSFALARLQAILAAPAPVAAPIAPISA